jgi:hypothetical protein
MTNKIRIFLIIVLVISYSVPAGSPEAWMVKGRDPGAVPGNQNTSAGTMDGSNRADLKKISFFSGTLSHFFYFYMNRMKNPLKSTTETHVKQKTSGREIFLRVSFEAIY